MDEGRTAAASAQVSDAHARVRRQRQGLIPLAVGALAVLAVLGAAAHAGVRLSDRGPLADQRGPLIAIAVIFFFVDTFIIMLIRRAMLRRRGERDGDRPLDLTADRESWWVTLIAYVLFLALIILPAALLARVLQKRNAEQRDSDSEPTLVVPNQEVPREVIADFVYVLFLLLSMLAILIAVVVTYLQIRRRLPRTLPFGIGADGEGPGIDEVAFASAIEAGASAIERVTHPREAIIACYAAMESTLAAHGSPRRAADTPSELLDRAAAAGLVRSAASVTLTDLFREARFSPHPMAAADVEAATAALTQLRADVETRA